MRCLLGFVMFVVLYFGSCSVLGEVVAAMTLKSGQGYSERGAQKVGKEFVYKYHAVVAVATGIVTLLTCCLPTLAAKMSEREADAWQ